MNVCLYANVNMCGVVLATKMRGNERWYYVHWQDDTTSWEPESALIFLE